MGTEYTVIGTAVGRNRILEHLAATLAQEAMRIRTLSHDDADRPRDTTRGRASVAAADSLRLYGAARARFLRECGA